MQNGEMYLIWLRTLRTKEGGSWSEVPEAGQEWEGRGESLQGRETEGAAGPPCVTAMDHVLHSCHPASVTCWDAGWAAQLVICAWLSEAPGT